MQEIGQYINLVYSTEENKMDNIDEDYIDFNLGEFILHKRDTGVGSIQNCTLKHTQEKKKVLSGDIMKVMNW